eukprot:TRINITY_DN58648_c0_g1_i2.p1 TRINITY_DN58648_c0_g1~~TRINITY_DN58648_c0_g1_i2.p1  ORF type:complete len:337 (-),score=38.27 TRINITY_DN58648_c0_g1_i2:11-880(-)
MSLVAGQFIDMFGLPFMFIGYAAIQAVNIVICIIWLPPAHSGGRSTEHSPEGQRSTSFLQLLRSFDVLWFFVNLLQYGLAMSLVENFLLVFLLQDFYNTPKVLLGASVTCMCVFEIPVFKYIALLWSKHGYSLNSILLGCQGILVLRCLLYTALPPSQPWLVLLIEPLHGLTFGAMWAATVEYGQRLAPEGSTAKMQSLVNGIFYNVAMGLGSVLWGSSVAEPPKGLGFKPCFLINCVFIVCWSIVWQVGLAVRRCNRRRSSSAADPDSLQPTALLSMCEAGAGAGSRQ